MGAITYAVPTVTAIWWGDLSLFGSAVPGGRFKVLSLEGWEELPSVREGWQSRPQAHGMFDAPVWANERRILISGSCSRREDRDALLHELQRKLAFPSGEGALRELTITNAGRTLTAGARLTRFKATMENWGAGVFGWAAEWVAPDPLRYSQPVTYSTGSPTAEGGLAFPLFHSDYLGRTTGVLSFGPAPAEGRLTVSNEGTADTWPVLRVVGTPVGGFAVQHVESGRRVEYVGDVPAPYVLEVDSGTGTAVLVHPDTGRLLADRSGMLTRREWVPVPAGGSASFQFTAPTFAAAARLDVTVRGAWW